MGDAKTPTTIFVGNVLTMVDSAQRAEAVAVKNGKILAVGSRTDVEAAVAVSDKNPEIRELAPGTLLMPAFIDPHSHFINALAMSTMVNISYPPVGPCSLPEEIVKELKRAADSKGLKPGDTFVGYGYDDSMFSKENQLNKYHLDTVFTENPVLVMHVSLHGCVCNSKALAKYDITADTPTPTGGIIVRKDGSNEPLGLVMEMAFLPIFSSLPAPTPAQEMEQLKAGQMIYAAAGICTAQEGATHAHQVELLQRGAKEGALFLDVVSYPFVTDAEEVFKKNPPSTFGKYDNRLKLGGIKITMDGSPQGRTAYFTKPYLTGGPGGEKDWHGEPSFPQEFFNDILTKCYDQNLQGDFGASFFGYKPALTLFLALPVSSSVPCQWRCCNRHGDQGSRSRCQR